MQITIDEYKGTLHRYYIHSCAIRERNIFGFTASRWCTDEEVEEEEREQYDPTLRPKRLLTFFRDDEIGDQWGATQYIGWSYIALGSANQPKSQFIVAELEGRIHVIGSGEDYRDTPLSGKWPGNPNRGSITRVRTIGGSAYICGGNRTAGKRLGKGSWLSHYDSMHKAQEIRHGGFEDIDGFSEDDIYAVGGKGDVWHFNGKKWSQIHFPTNTWTTAVCCGADGNVYIGCIEGLTFMGQGNRWKKIYDGGLTLGFNYMEWYEDRVWCTNDYGLWVIHKGKVTEATGLPSEVRVCAGSIAAADGVLLVAGLGGAACLENGKWQSIFLRDEMERMVLGSEGK